MSIAMKANISAHFILCPCMRRYDNSVRRPRHVTFCYEKCYVRSQQQYILDFVTHVLQDRLVRLVDSWVDTSIVYSVRQQIRSITYRVPWGRRSQSNLQKSRMITTSLFFIAFRERVQSSFQAKATRYLFYAVSNYCHRLLPEITTRFNNKLSGKL